MKIARLNDAYDGITDAFDNQFGEHGEDVFYKCQDLDPNNIPGLIDFIKKEAGFVPSLTQVLFLHEFIPAAYHVEEAAKALEGALGAIEEEGAGDEEVTAAYLRAVKKDSEDDKR